MNQRDKWKKFIPVIAGLFQIQNQARFFCVEISDQVLIEEK